MAKVVVFFNLQLSLIQITQSVILYHFEVAKKKLLVIAPDILNASK